MRLGPHGDREGGTVLPDLRLRELDSGEVLIVYHRRTVGDTVPHHRRLCIDRMKIEDGRILPVVMTEGFEI